MRFLARFLCFLLMIKPIASINISLRAVMHKRGAKAYDLFIWLQTNCCDVQLQDITYHRIVALLMVIVLLVAYFNFT